MLKLLFVVPALVFGSILFGVAALVFVPLLAVLPIVLALGACVLAFSLVVGILSLILRLFGAVLFGGLIIAGVGTAAVVGGGLVAIVLGIALFHLLLPIIFIVGLIWLIHRASQPKPAQLAHL